MAFLTVLLTILKIIGIVLGAIIGLLLLLLCLVLFVPVRYRGRVNYTGKPDILIKASYLLHIVTVRVTMNEGSTEMAVRIFGHRLGTGKKKAKKSRRSRKNTHEEKVQAFRNEPAVTPKPQQKTETEAKPDVPIQRSRTYEAPPTQKNKEKPKKGIFKKLKDKYNSFRETWNTFKDKRESIFTRINDEGNRAAVRSSFGALGKILKHIHPRRHRIRITFGTGDPAATGEILGAIYAAAALIGINIVVTPDFDNKIFECYAEFKGRIRVFTLGMIALKLYRNKDFKKLIRMIMDR